MLLLDRSVISTVNAKTLCRIRSLNSYLSMMSNIWTTHSKFFFSMSSRSVLNISSKVCSVSCVVNALSQVPVQDILTYGNRFRHGRLGVAHICFNDCKDTICIGRHAMCCLLIWVVLSLFCASTCARIPLAPEDRHLMHPPAEGSRWAATEAM